MQSMIASQQQLIRRSINSNNNSINNSPNHNINKSVNSVTNEECHHLSVSHTVIATESTSDANLELTSNTPQSAQPSSDTCQPVIDSETKKSSDKTGVKKKRSNSSWLNILNPSYKSRHEEFKRLFSSSVPNNERLVVDYSCALQKEILVHGRLYLSLNYIAFYANIFTWETSLVIKCREISALSKTNTARVIPNAIQVVTNSGDKYVFTSFAARDKTHVMLFRLWQNALLDQPMSNTELWQWIHYNYGEDLGLTSEDDEEYYNENIFSTIPDHSPAVETSDSCHSSDPDFNAESDVYEDCRDHISVYSQCKCVTHEGKLIIDITFPITVDRAFELIFTDSQFVHHLHKKRRTYDLCVAQWQDSEHDKYRQLNYTVALNHALVKSAPTIEVQRLHKDSVPGSFYMVKSVANNEGIPYCDTFSMHSKWCLSQDSQNVTHLKVHANVLFRKSNWSLSLMKPMIEKSSIQGITDFCKDLVKEMPVWLEMEQKLVNGLKGIEMNDLKTDYTDSSTCSNNDTIVQKKIIPLESLNDSTNQISFTDPKSLFSNTFKFQINDAFLLKVLIIVLTLIFFLNIIVFIRLSEIESKINEFNAVSHETVQNIDNSSHWKQFIDNAIKMIKKIESNLILLKDRMKDEL